MYKGQTSEAAEYLDQEIERMVKEEEGKSEVIDGWLYRDGKRVKDGAPKPGEEDLLPIEQLMRKLSDEDKSILSDYETEIEKKTLESTLKRIPIFVIAYNLQKRRITPFDAISEYTEIEMWLEMEGKNLDDWTFEL